MHPADHIADETLSAFVDDQLTSDEGRQVQVHLEACLDCRARFAELRSLVGLLQRLTSLDPPRDFSLGPRLVRDPPNIVRLRRWYGVARAGAASLAAAFVFLSVGALYVDSRPTPTSSDAASGTTLALAPAAPEPSPLARSAAAAPAAADSARAATSAQSGSASNAARPAAPAAPPPAAAERPAPPPTEEIAEQVKAATSVQPLPTPVPTFGAVPTQTSAQVARQPLAVPTGDPAAPLRTAATVVGLLAVAGVLVTLVVRNRLRAASIATTE